MIFKTTAIFYFIVTVQLYPILIKNGLFYLKPILTSEINQNRNDDYRKYYRYKDIDHGVTVFCCSFLFSCQCSKSKTGNLTFCRWSRHQTDRYTNHNTCQKHEYSHMGKIDGGEIVPDSATSLIHAQFCNDPQCAHDQTKEKGCNRPLSIDSFP